MYGKKYLTYKLKHLHDQYPKNAYHVLTQPHQGAPNGLVPYAKSILI